MRADMKKLAVIEGYLMRGSHVGRFHYRRGDVEFVNGRIVSPTLDVEPVFQNLEFHRGDRKDFLALYEIAHTDAKKLLMVEKNEGN